MASLPPGRAPSNSCVQNQTASATIVMMMRSASGFHRAERVVTCSISGAISGELIAKFLHTAQIEFAGAEIRHGLDFAKLVGTRLPQSGQVGFAQFG